MQEEFEIEFIPEPTQQSQPNSILRNVGRVAARGAEALAGLPGDVLSAGLGAGSFITGGRIPTYESLQEKFPNVPTLPTSSQLRETVTKGLTGQALEPQTEGEETFDTFVQDIATLALPVKGRIPFKSALAKSVAGNAASWLTKELGGSEAAQAGAKLGILTAAGLAGGRRALTKQMNESYKTAEELSKGAAVSAKNLSQETKSLLEQVSKGHGTPAKELVKGPLKSIEKHIKNGKISVTDAWEIKRDINDLIFNPETSKQARTLLRKAIAPVNKVIAEFGAKSPEFKKNFSFAEDIFKGLNDRSVINKFLQKHVSVQGSMKNPLTKILLLGGSYHFGGLPGVGGAAAAIGLGIAAREGVQAAEFIFKSPSARKYYADILRDSAAGNVAAAKRNIQKLDKIADQYDKNLSRQDNGEFEVEFIPS